MAKLPGISFRQVSIPKGTSPGTAVQEYQGRQQVARDLVTLGNNLAQMKAQYDIGEANAGIADEMSSFEQQYSGKQTYTPEEIRDLGLEDVVETSSGAMDSQGRPVQREFIPAHEVYPYALQRASEEAIERNADKISGSAQRKAWLTDMRTKHNQVVSNAVKVAGQNAYRETVTNLKNRADVNQQLGRFAVAEANIMAMPIPDDEKNLLLLDNKQKMSIYEANDVIATGTDQELEMLVTLTSTDEYREQSGLSADQVKTVRSAAMAEENNRESQYWEDRRRNQNAAATELVTGVLTGEVTKGMILEASPRLGYELTKGLYNMADERGRTATKETPFEIQSGFSQIMMRMEMGNYGEGETIDTLYREGMEYIFDNIATVDDNGAPVAGITEQDRQTYFNRLQEARKQVMENPTYKQIMDNAKLRIANISPDSIYSDGVSEDNANLLAVFRDELLDFIRTENPDAQRLKQWESDNLPRYLSNKGNAAISRLPKSIWKRAVFREGEDGEKLFDTNATLIPLQMQTKGLRDALDENPDNPRLRAQLESIERDWLTVLEMIESGELNALDTE